MQNAAVPSASDGGFPPGCDGPDCFDSLAAAGVEPVLEVYVRVAVRDDELDPLAQLRQLGVPFHRHRAGRHLHLASVGVASGCEKRARASHRDLSIDSRILSDTESQTLSKMAGWNLNRLRDPISSDPHRRHASPTHCQESPLSRNAASTGGREPADARGYRKAWRVSSWGIARG